jgi:hypothetical protein
MLLHFSLLGISGVRPVLRSGHHKRVTDCCLQATIKIFTPNRRCGNKWSYSCTGVAKDSVVTILGPQSLDAGSRSIAFAMKAVIRATDVRGAVRIHGLAVQIWTRTGPIHAFGSVAVSGAMYCLQPRKEVPKDEDSDSAPRSVALNASVRLSSAWEIACTLVQVPLSHVITIPSVARICTA